MKTAEAGEESKRNSEQRNWTNTRSTFRHPRLRIWLSQGGVKNKPITAMLDSGSSISTISPETVRKLGLTTQANNLPSTIRNADGTNTKGGWTRNVVAWINTGVSEGKMRIAVVATHDDKFLLGNDWIQRYKPTINWSTGVVSTRFGKTRLLGTSHLRQALTIIDRRKQKKIKDQGQSWWKTDASQSCIDSESESENEIVIKKAPTTKDSQHVDPEKKVKEILREPKQETPEMRNIWAEQNRLAQEVSKKLAEQAQEEKDKWQDMSDLKKETDEIDRVNIAQNPVYGGDTPRASEGKTDKEPSENPDKKKKRKDRVQNKGRPYHIPQSISRKASQTTEGEDSAHHSPVRSPVVGRRIVQVDRSVVHRRRWVPTRGDKKVKEDSYKIKDKALQLRKKLTKISSIAQKYALEKAAAQGTTDGPNDLQEWLPEQIRDYEDRFSEERAKRLPKNSRWDMTIEFRDDVTPPGYRPVYALSPQEKEAVEEFIKENLEKGWIRREDKGEYVIASPIFFTGGKSKARLVIDYREVNKLCKADPFPIPLMHTLPDELKNAKYFTTLDLRSGYNNIRIRPEDEAKAGFRTHQGVYIPRVMQFGMMNSPAVFQRAMNEIFDDMIRQGVLIYLDDIIIYAENEQELWRLTREVLERLRKVDFYLNPAKCHFNLQELDYLGFIVGKEGLKMDPYKVKAVQEWPELKNKRDIRKFIGFANFYRKFIDNYSNIVRPLTTLLSKKRTFTWGESQQQAVAKLKEAFTKAPVLVRPDYDKQFILETDASLVAMGAVLSQEQEDGSVRPIAYWSGTFNAAERNYGVGDRELLGIVKAFEVWRHHLEGAKEEVKVITDHANLTTFMEKKKLNRRQARWATELSRFRFKIQHRAGKRNGRADALSRRPDHDGSDEDNQDMILLPKTLFEPIINFREAINLTDKILAESYKIEWDNEYTIQPNGLTCRGKQIVVPPNEEIKTMITRTNHDEPMAGHPGPEKTIELVQRRFYWPKMREWITEYVQSCEECQKNKARRGKTQPPLEPLPVPEGPWEHITMDFITGLPETKNGQNAILTVVDRFSKMAIFIPCKDTTDSIQTAQLLAKHVYSKHGIPKVITTDRGPQFVSKVTKEIYNLWNITAAVSTAYHPQTDGQSERMNQEVEQFLRFYVNQEQNDWEDWIHLAEFAINDRQSSATNTTPFRAIYGRDPRRPLEIDTSLEPSRIETVDKWKKRLEKEHEKIKLCIQNAQEQMKKYTDKHRGETPEYRVGDKVLLDGRNLTLLVPTRKFAKRNLGPYKIVKKHGKLNYELALPRNIRIHPVIYAGLLIPYKTKDYPGRMVGINPDPEIINDEPEYEVEEILDIRKEGNKYQYHVKWEGYSEDEATWEPLDKGLANASEYIKEWHEANPDKPKPPNLSSWLKRHLPKDL